MKCFSFCSRLERVASVDHARRRPFGFLISQFLRSYPSFPSLEFLAVLHNGFVTPFSFWDSISLDYMNDFSPFDKEYLPRLL